MREYASIMMNMINCAGIYLEKNNAEYAHCQTFKIERFAKGRRGGGVGELGSFDKGTS